MQRKVDTPHNLDLFADQTAQPPSDELIGPGSWLFRWFALPAMQQLLADLEDTLEFYPCRQRQPPCGLN
ncbi:alpha-ketoglutarate-dependent dioxygenase AlkB, partial [Pseudomonas syringae pv. tagetis]